MELTKNLLWVYPAVVMTLWTLLTLLLAWTLPLKQRVPLVISTHGLLLVLNPKDEYLYQRPSLLAALGFLAAGVIPIFCALMLIFQVLVSSLYLFEAVNFPSLKEGASNFAVFIFLLRRDVREVGRAHPRLI